MTPLTTCSFSHILPQLLVHIFSREERTVYSSCFSSATLTSQMTGTDWGIAMCVNVPRVFWKVPWILCFWSVLNLTPFPFDPKLLAPRAASTSTSGNLDLVSVIGLTGHSFSVLPKRFWSKFWFYPWQIVSDSIAHPNPSHTWLGWSPSQTDPGMVMEHHAALRSHDHCPVFISPSALLYAPNR